MTDPIIEAAARKALIARMEDFDEHPVYASVWIEAILAAVTPLIEAAALERAAKLVEKHKIFGHPLVADQIADAIRALIVKDSGGGD